MVKRTMKKRVVLRLVWGGRKPFLGLLLGAILGMDGEECLFDASEKNKISRGSFDGFESQV